MATRNVRRLALAALTALLIPIAAEASHGPKVLIGVYAPADRRQIGTLDAGDRYDLRAGESVRLQIYDPAYDNPGQDQRHRVAGTFSLAGDAGVLKLTGAEPGEGHVWVTARKDVRRATEQRIVFHPQGPNVAGGELIVSVLPAPTAVSSTQPSPQSAQELAADLYRAILLREPQGGESATWAERIRREGYGALPEIARDFANSNESRIGIYERTEMSNQKRLLALYSHLLDRDARSIDVATWDRQLDSLSRGDIASVVVSMVQSVEFARAHGLEERLALR